MSRYKDIIIIGLLGLRDSGELTQDQIKKLSSQLHKELDYTKNHEEIK